MIIYSGTLSRFSEDILHGVIAERIEQCFLERGYHHNNAGEVRAWNQSLFVMNNVLCNQSGIDQGVQVAIEYQIPLTAKRVDFLVTGYDESGKENVVIIELKQWDEAQATEREDVVSTFLGGAKRAVSHPSYQAYSYAKAIESFNETVRHQDIRLHPCAFCHNFPNEQGPSSLTNPRYGKAIELAPLFLKQDQLKLREFVKRHIKKPDRGEILYTIENGKIKPSIALQDAVSSLLEGNETFTMIDEQKVAFSTIKALVDAAIKQTQKHTIVVQGGPGTGKSVIAIQMLAHLLREGHNVEYVTKNAAPRHVFLAKLIEKDYKKRYVENLFKGSGSFVNVEENFFDCLLVDEAHRLNEKSGLFQNLGENQIKELIRAAKISVFFLDEDQAVTSKDIGTLEEISRWAKEMGSTLHCGFDLTLTSQFRCNGSDGYLAFLDDALGIRETANRDLGGLDYDFRVYDDPNDLYRALKEKNDVNNKSRLLAGYCYDWVSKKNPDAYDIALKNGFKARWNLSSTNTYAIDETSFEQVGCIHTVQGLEFDYCGVILGKDIAYRDGKVVTDASKRAKTDRSLAGCRDQAKIDRIIRNTYKTLMSRGQKGCFVYCEDEPLAAHLKALLSANRDD